MKSLILVCLLFSVLAWGALPASAQIMDTTPNVIGFFVDPVGNVPGVCLPFTAHTVYLMITRPSDQSGLTAYQCSFEVPPIIISLGFMPTGGIIILDTFPILDVAYATPISPQGNTYILGVWNLLFTGTETDHVMLIDHFPGESFAAAYMAASGPDLIPIRAPAWGHPMDICRPPGNTVLVINDFACCDYVIDTERTAWGELKSLFR